MTSTLIDSTTDFNANAKVQLDVSGWDYVIVQLVSPTGTVTFKSTNDGGESTGTINSSPQTATNWVAIQGTNLNTGTAITTIAASGIIKFNQVGRFLQLESVGQTVGKCLVQLTKIY